MKNQVLTFLMLFGVWAAQGQPIITYEDQSMHPGDYHQTVFTSYENPGKGGEKQVWDFSDQRLINNHHAEIMPAGETPYADTFPGANMAIKEHGNYFYFDVQPAASSYHGYVKNDHLVISYDKPADKMHYPFHFKDYFSGDFTASTEVSTIYGSYSVEADGYGTLKLPGDIVLYNVLRVKSTKDFVEQACNAVHAHTEKYMWYHPDYRYPVYVMFYRKEQYTGREKPKVYQYGILSKTLQKRKNVTGLPEKEKQHTYKMLPNPFIEVAKIQYQLKAAAEVVIEVFEMKGNKVTTLKNQKQKPGSYQVSFKPKRVDAKPGNYLVKIVLGKQTHLEKLIYLSE